MVCPRGVFRESWDGALWCVQGVFSGSPGTGLYGVSKVVFSGSPGTGLYGVSKVVFSGSPGTGLYGVPKGCFQGVLGRGFMVYPRGVFRESWDGALWCAQGVFSGSPGTGLYGVSKGCFQEVLGWGFMVCPRGVFSESCDGALQGVAQEGVFTRRWSVLRWDITVCVCGGGGGPRVSYGGPRGVYNKVVFIIFYDVVVYNSKLIQHKQLPNYSSVHHSTGWTGHH